MPVLPPIASARDHPGAGSDGNNLRLCLHLTSEVENQKDDFETIRRRKAAKMKEAARRRGEEIPQDSSLLPEVKKILPSRIRAVRTQVVKEIGHIVRLETVVDNGGSGADEECSSPSRQNISHTGSWLDRRSFASVNEMYYGGGANRRHTSAAGPRGELTEGDKVFVRRCKELLKKRYNSLQSAWGKLDLNHSDSLTLTEFVASTSGLFKSFEARLLYRLLDANGDGIVTLGELQSLLENA